MTDVLIAEDTAVEEARQGKRLPTWSRSPKVLAGAGLIGVFVLLAIIGPVIAPYAPSATSSAALAPPSLAHLFGTTNTGEDVLSEVLVGARQSILVGFVAAGIGEGIAVLIGITAGYLEGIAGEVLNTVINIVLVIPILPLEIVLASFLSGQGWLGIALVIAATAWARPARVLRAQTRSIRKRDYVEAARVAGEPKRRIVGFEVLPNVTALIITGMLFHVLMAIVVQTSLAFLGIGNVSGWSWGNILYWADNATAFLTGAWWWYVPPGICLALVGMGLALVNLGLDEVINPKLRTSGLKAPRRRWLARASGTTDGAGPTSGGAE